MEEITQQHQEETKPTREISTVDEAIRFVEEMREKKANLTDEEKEEARKRAYQHFNNIMKEMNRIWESLPRRRKRKIMNPKMKYSVQAVKRIKAAERRRTGK